LSFFVGSLEHGVKSPGVLSEGWTPDKRWRTYRPMNVIVDLCIIPIGVGVSLSPYVAVCEKVLTEAGLKTVLHANGTNIEGEWDKVFAAVRRCHEVVHEKGAPRVFTVMKLGTRTDRTRTMDEKTKSVETKLASLQKPR
jgi:uncharacterized protein (TIGR00106 family)